MPLPPCARTRRAIPHSIPGLAAFAKTISFVLAMSIPSKGRSSHTNLASSYLPHEAVGEDNVAGQKMQSEGFRDEGPHDFDGVRR